MIRATSASVLYPPVRGDIAIIGVGCTYPGARRATDFWQNILNKVDAIAEVNPNRWDPDEFYDPDPNTPDRLYWKKGGWIPDTYSFNPLKFGIPPASINGAEPDQCLLIRCVFEALEDAGYVNKPYDKDRVSVMVGRGNYVGPGLMWLTMRTAVTEMIVKIMREMRPDLTPSQMEKLKEFIRAKMPRLTPEAAGGLVPNIATGRVANRFDFMGRNFTVDGACASALLASEIAVRNLLTGIDDMAIIGGLHIFNSVPFLSVFKIARAISFTETMRPFDAKADGTMCGEGVGTLVLKRLADAERDRDRIYAVIKGVGSASDGRAKAVMAPRLEGQVTAIERAFEMAQLPPQSIELVECHGTATVVGDATELESLESVYGPADSGRPVCAIGSVKSMIGHAMPASGAASLIKTALALYHKVLPPTLNVEQPHPLLRKPDTRFYVNSEARPWIHAGGVPRRAAVSAFGFGGINAHVILEEYAKADETKQPSHLRDWESEVFVIEADGRASLIAALDRIRSYAIQVEGVAPRDLAYTLNTSLTGAPCRVAIVASSFEDLAQKIDRVKQRLAAPETNQIRERSGLYYFESQELRSGEIALMFPGEGSQYLNMLSDLCIHFPEVRQSFDAADAAVKDPSYAPPSAIIFPPPAFDEKEEAAQEARLWTIERATESVLTAGGAMYTLIGKLGIQAGMMTGHSAGEWIAMAASGMVDVPEFISSMDRLGLMYKKVSQTTGIPRMAMLAIGAGREKILEQAALLNCEVHIANDNCPHQVVAVVDPAIADAFSSHLLKNGIFVERLPYDRGYHTPSFTYICEPLREFFQGLNLRPPKSPVYSCTTTETYPREYDAILDTVANTFARPLLFQQTIERMYQAGARIFIESGPRGNLTAFVDDVLRGKPHLCVPMDVYRRSGISSLNHALGMLAAAHVKLDFSILYDRRQPRKLSLDTKADSILPEEKQPGMMQISNCYYLLESPPSGSFPMPSQPVAAAPRTPAFASPVPAIADLAAVPMADPVTIPRESSVPSALPAGAIPSSVLLDHFSLMEDFLRTEEDIMGQILASATAPQPSAPPPSSAPAIRSLLHEAATLEEVPGESITLRLPLSTCEHRYLLDHSLYFEASEFGNEADRIYTMPATCSIEMMCQAAGLLDPGRKVIAVKGVQVFRRLSVVGNHEPVSLQVTAKRVKPGEFIASLREDAEDGGAYSRCTVILADDYPPAPAPVELVLQDPKVKQVCTGKDLYTDHHVFHGPAFQGVRTIDQVGVNGVIATLEVLPKNALIASDPDPAQHIDPHLLDACGQLAGYWPVEYLASGYVVLPIRFQEVAKFCDNPPAGTLIPCRLTIREVTPRTLVADFDALLPDGRLWMRTTGWEDWRFFWPPHFFDFWRFPKKNLSSLPVEIPALEKAGYYCRYINTLADHEKDPLSEEVWTHVLLDRQENEQILAIPVEQRPEWMFTLSVAKDAVRAWTAKTRGRDLYPADIELTSHPDRTVTASGTWTGEFTPPLVATLFENHSAFGVAGADRAAIGLALACETSAGAFLPEEEDRLNRMADPAEWKARALAAKRAVARFLRPGASPAEWSGYWSSLLITRIDTAAGVFEIADPDMAINAEDAVNAATGHLEDRIVGVAFR
jgi:acyl transferase domain-containing protein